MTNIAARTSARSTTSSLTRTHARTRINPGGTRIASGSRTAPAENAAAGLVALASEASRRRRGAWPGAPWRVDGAPGASPRSRCNVGEDKNPRTTRWHITGA